MADPNDGTPMNVDTAGAGGASGSTGTTDTGIKNPDNLVMKVHHIYVGQGDSSLIVVKEGEKKYAFSEIHKAVLIDAGDNNEVGKRVLCYLDQCLLHNPGVNTTVIDQQNPGSSHLQRKPLDVIFNSHPDSDHIVGLPLIIYSFMCDANTKIYDQGDLYTTQGAKIEDDPKEDHYETTCVKNYDVTIEAKRYLLQYEILCNSGLYNKDFFASCKKSIDDNYLQTFKTALNTYNNKGNDSEIDNHCIFTDYLKWVETEVNSVNEIANQIHLLPNKLAERLGLMIGISNNPDLTEAICRIFAEIIDLFSQNEYNREVVCRDLKEYDQSIVNSSLDTFDNKGDELQKCLIRPTDPGEFYACPQQGLLKDLVGKEITSIKDSNLKLLFAMTCVAINQNVIGRPEVVADSKSGTPVNQRSLAFLVYFNGYYYYTGGDIGNTQETAIASWIKSESIIIDAFKVSHHGSEHSTPQVLVDQCDESTCAFVSYGWENTHAHPRYEVFDRILAKNIKLYLTSLIKFIGSGGDDSPRPSKKAKSTASTSFNKLIQLSELGNFVSGNNPPEAGCGQNSRNQVRYTAPGTIVLKVPNIVQNKQRKVDVSFDQLLEPDKTFPVGSTTQIIIDIKILSELIIKYAREQSVLEKMKQRKRTKPPSQKDLSSFAKTNATPLLESLKAVGCMSQDGTINPTYNYDESVFSQQISGSSIDNSLKTNSFYRYVSNSLNRFRSVQVAAKRVRLNDRNKKIQGMKMTIPVRGGTP